MAINCPYCDEPCEAPTVDVGVGEIQCGPYGCDLCESVQIGPFDKPDRPLTQKEKDVGWHKPRYVVTYEFPPIPDRQFDWCAYQDGEEEEGLRGYGKTKREALVNLLDQIKPEIQCKDFEEL
jgi:hypothetical protein